MSEIKLNLDRIRDCGEDIIKLVEELKLTYGTMFDRLERVPEVTKEWVGPTSKEYFDSVSREKKYYMEYANELYKYGKFLIDTASEYEYLLNGIRR